MAANEETKTIDALFSSAQKNGGMEYLYALVRVQGISNYQKDSILALYDALRAADENDLASLRELVLGAYPIYSLLANLVNCSEGKRYASQPFSVGPKGRFPEFMPPKPGLFINELIAKVDSIKEQNKEFFDLINSVFSKKFLEAVADAAANLNDWRYELHRICGFLIGFLETYFETLKTFRETNRCQIFERRFEVLEILSDSKTGLYGFSIHYSNGSRSTFQRLANRTECVNISFKNSNVSLFMGSFDDLKPIWLVDGRPLYEIGLPGRYNVTGEWKPLVYPGDSSLLREKARGLTKDKSESRIEGCLFYSMITCHHAIEFIVTSNFDLPYPVHVAESSWGTLVLERIDVQEVGTNQAANRRAYDGTLYLPKFGVEEVENGLRLIHLTLNRLAFRLDGKFEWLLKYPLVTALGGVINTEEEDTRVLADYLKNLNGSDAVIIDSAIDWYVNGNKAENVFNKYLSYCIAIEALALPLIEGDMEASGKYTGSRPAKSEMEHNRKLCIHKKYADLYETDPTRFIREAYFECVLSLKKSVENALNAVFGKQHPFVTMMFDKIDGYSLYDLRSKLAHGSFSLTDTGHEEIIRKRIGDISTIAQEFILRLSMGIQPGENYRKFARTASVSLTTLDPRTTAVLSDISLIPKQDWRIKWGWLN